MPDYIDQQTGLLNSKFLTPISNDTLNKQWYVITNNTSWCNVEEAVLSGPYTTKEEALSHCWDTSCWPELLLPEEAQSKTY